MSGKGEPDLVSVSGREDLPVGDRVGLLRAALLSPPLNGLPTCSVTQEIHDLKLTVGWTRGAIGLYDAAVARGENGDRLQRGSHLILSPVECLILAWKRGGHREFERIRSAQRGCGSPLMWLFDPGTDGRSSP